jgi:hypothetical protein
MRQGPIHIAKAGGNSKSTNPEDQNRTGISDGRETHLDVPHICAPEVQNDSIHWRSDDRMFLSLDPEELVQKAPMTRMQIAIRT